MIGKNFTNLNIHIVKQGQALKHDLFKHTIDVPEILDLQNALVIEHATTRGKCGVWLVAKRKDDAPLVFQTTGAMIEGLSSSIKGVEERLNGGPKEADVFLSEGANDREIYMDFAQVDGMKDIDKLTIKGMDTNKVSDGYHTFGELYEHRIVLYMLLCRLLQRPPHNRKVWRSLLHSDGTHFDGWFVLGINTEPGIQVTYHLPVDKWHITECAETLEKAPDFDGHNSGDVLDRLTAML
jgi:hypothetical protein